MSRKKLNTPIAGEDPERGMKEVINALNFGSRANERLDSAAHSKLLRVVKAWKASGPDLGKMKVPLEDRVQLQDMEKAWRFHLANVGSGRACWFASPTGENFRDLVS